MQATEAAAPNESAGALKRTLHSHADYHVYSAVRGSQRSNRKLNTPVFHAMKRLNER